MFDGDPRFWTGSFLYWRGCLHFRFSTKSRQKAYPLLHALYAFLSPTASMVSVFICPSLRSARWDGFLQMGLERRAAPRASPRGSATRRRWRARAELCLLPLSLGTAASGAAWVRFLLEGGLLLPRTLLQPLQISPLGQQTWVFRMNTWGAWCALNSVDFLEVEAMPCVPNIRSNEQRLGGFIIIYKPFAASSPGILLLPAKAYLWKRSYTRSYCCHPLHNYKTVKQNFIIHVSNSLLMSKSRDFNYSFVIFL